MFCSVNSATGVSTGVGEGEHEPTHARREPFGTIHEVAPGSPSHVAGLRDGDRVVLSLENGVICVWMAQFALGIYCVCEICCAA